MADNQKYYYIRLKDNFFDSDSIALLESMQDGYLYSNILLKLYLRSLKDDGRLMFNDKIPYNSQMIATITRHQVGTIEKALNIFADMGLIEILDNGAIYMLDIQNFIGTSTTEADRKRKSRSRIEQEIKSIGQMSDKSTPEIEIEKEIELELEIKKEIKIKKESKRFSKPTIEEIENYITLNNINIDANHFYDYYEANGWLVGKNKMKDWKATIRNWSRRNNTGGTTKQGYKAQAMDDTFEAFRELHKKYENN